MRIPLLLTYEDQKLMYHDLIIRNINLGNNYLSGWATIHPRSRGEWWLIFYGARFVLSEVDLLAIANLKGVPITMINQFIVEEQMLEKTNE